MEKGNTGIRRVIVFVVLVFAMVLISIRTASAEGNFTVCINATSNSGDNIDYVLYAEPNDARDRLYDVNGTGSISGIANFNFLFSGTADVTTGGVIVLSLNGDTIEGDNQYSLFFNTTMNNIEGSWFGSFIGGLIITDLTNSDPEERYKLQGTAQILECE